MNKFKRKPVAQSPAALGRQMAADAQRMRKKIEKQKLVTSEIKWLGASATAATVDDVVKLGQDSYAAFARMFDWLPTPTVTSNGDGTYTHTYTFDSGKNYVDLDGDYMIGEVA